jgi:hypothetical protein
VLEHRQGHVPQKRISMNDSERTTPAPESATPEITRADQFAWEAPELRPTFIPDGERETWAYPCPDWCTGEGLGHDAERILAKFRTHQSAALRIRQDGGLGYETSDDPHDELGDDDGIRATNLEVSLVASSRVMTPRVQLVAHYGDGAGNHKSFRLVGLYPDEVRELICVLQHLLKVGQA